MKADCVSVHNPAYHQLAADVLRDGGLIAIPTETYYGIAVDAFNESALERVFVLKKRPSVKPILVLIDHRDELEDLAREVPDPFLPLMDRYWPGPLTLVFPAKKALSPILTGGTGTVGVRVSSCPYPRAICRELKRPITATSANISGQPPARSYQDIVRYFGNTIDLVVDGGVSDHCPGSTVVSCAGNQVKVIRQGLVDLGQR